MLEGGSSGGLGMLARVCDSCRAAACAVYSRAESAYLCAGCDARIHAINRMPSQHERVLMCEACERAPAAFTCKADAAALCTSCDADIHSANPLAKRHHRVPILPITGCLYAPWATQPGRPVGSMVNLEEGFLASQTEEEDEVEVEEEEAETASRLLLNPVKNNNQSRSNGYLFGGEIDEYLDLSEYNSCAESFSVQQNQVKNDGSDSVVPVQGGKLEQQQHPQNLQLEMDYEASKAGFSYIASMSRSVSLSSMDTSIVPESMMNDISNSHSRPPKGTIDLFSSPPLQMPPQFTPMDREARVLRYKEKKKTRKFEKTIRYASRKAYAETRPRIKGRFAKRTDVEVEVDQMFATNVMAEGGFGIVPLF